MKYENKYDKVLNNFSLQSFKLSLCTMEKALFHVNANQIGTVFAEMSSWTALPWHIGIKKAFYTKYTKANIYRLSS